MEKYMFNYTLFLKSFSNLLNISSPGKTRASYRLSHMLQEARHSDDSGNIKNDFMAIGKDISLAIQKYDNYATTKSGHARFQ